MPHYHHYPSTLSPHERSFPYRDPSAGIEPCQACLHGKELWEMTDNENLVRLQVDLARTRNAFQVALVYPAAANLSERLSSQLGPMPPLSGNTVMRCSRKVSAVFFLMGR